MARPKIKIFRERTGISTGARKHFGFKTIKEQEREAKPSRSKRIGQFLSPNRFRTTRAKPRSPRRKSKGRVDVFRRIAPARRSNISFRDREENASGLLFGWVS